MNDEFAKMNDTAPRCLGGRTAMAPDVLRQALASQYGPNATVFSPVCSCGETGLAVAAAPQLGPVRISCPTCTSTRVIFDPRVHGYEGELGLDKELSVEPEHPFACPSCGAATFDVAACFQYSGEDEVLEGDDAPDIAPRDLFGWAAFGVRCKNCGVMAQVADVECA